MTNAPAGYVKQAEDMARAARAWIAAHPYACLVLNTPDPDKMGLPPSEVAKMKAIIAMQPPGAKMGIISGLDDALKWWGGNEETRALLREMDRASGHQATYMQAQAALASVFESKGLA